MEQFEDLGKAEHGKWAERKCKQLNERMETIMEDGGRQLFSFQRETTDEKDDRDCNILDRHLRVQGTPLCTYPRVRSSEYDEDDNGVEKPVLADIFNVTHCFCFCFSHVPRIPFPFVVNCVSMRRGVPEK